MGIMSNSGGTSTLIIIMYLIYIVFFGIGLFCTILFIKLAFRGIKALDIYIAKNGK